jgi:hypothetical protein
VIAEPPDDDAHALYIKYKGREWVIMHSGDSFHAVAADEKMVSENEVRNLFGYLVSEGFINDPNQPPPTQTTI